MLAPWLQPQLTELLRQRGHAWLLQGASGLGQYELGLALVKAWLCEQRELDASFDLSHGQPAADAQLLPAADTRSQPGSGPPLAACGHCASCHALEVRTHADLKVLMPETLALQLDWPLDEKSLKDIEDKKRKPSQEIRIEAMRELIEFAQRSNARGRGKAVLIYPAERMNTVTANALLKTLEEPPGDTRFVLMTEQPQQLLPTIRSRCMQFSLTWPTLEQSLPWLQAQGLSSQLALGLLRAAGGRPEQVLNLLAASDPSAIAGQAAQYFERWSSMPKALKGGQHAFFADWSVAALLDAQQKLCHDLMLKAQGSEPRYFDAQALPAAPSLWALSQWWADLARSVRHQDHPYKPELYIESLVALGQKSLESVKSPSKS
jgi:DNA polymerase III subunit delta'